MSPSEFLTKHQSVLQVYCQDQMIRDDSMFQDCDDQESFAEVCPPKSTSPSAGQVTYPSSFQELTDMTLWCKEFPAFSQIICDKCARCQNLCLLCQPLSTRGSNANQGRWFTSLEGGLTVTWKEKIFRIWGRVCCSNLLPKGEFSPKILPRGKSWCRYVGFVSSARNSLR